MIHWAVGLLAVVALVFAVGRAGGLRGLRDPVTFFALALLVGSLGPIIRLPDGSMLDTVLVGVEIAATLYGLYLFVRHRQPPSPRR